MDYLRSPYQLNHWSATGGSIVYSTWNNYHDFYDINCLWEGTWIVERHTVEKTVTFSQTLSGTPYVWGRGVASTGYSSEDPNMGLGFCEVVPGSITSTSAKLRAYIYDFYIEDPYDGWLDWQGRCPAEPGDVVFAYTVLGIPAGAKISGTGNNIESSGRVESFALHQNFPNPFNPETFIQFDLPEAANVTLVIYDLKGHQVMELVSGNFKAGRHNFRWNGKDETGNRVASGVYIYEIKAGKFRQNRRMILLR